MPRQQKKVGAAFFGGGGGVTLWAIRPNLGYLNLPLNRVLIGNLRV